MGIVIEYSNIAAGGALAVTRTDSDGPDNIAFRAAGLNVASGGLFELNLFGGRGADTIMMIMEGGKIDGTARIMLDGGRGNHYLRGLILKQANATRTNHLSEWSGRHAQF